MDEEMDTTNAIDEEEERKLLAESSDNEEDDEEDSDDEDEDAVIEQNENEVRRIESILEKNPYDYESHKLLIEKLHEMGELERLRSARSNMKTMFPLSPEIWLAWLRDEMKLASSAEQKSDVLKLCETAVEDYLSVEVWLECLQFATGLGTDKETVDKNRILFEKALTAAGLHIQKGALIWDIYRDYENSIMNVTLTSDSERENEINRLGKLFRRQLACPLFGMEKTFEEYMVWKSSEGIKCIEDDNIIKMNYERAMKQLEERMPFEQKLESANNQSEKFDIYKAYLIKEKQIGDPGRVTLLYERAITDLCLEPNLWIDYLNYLENSLKINDIVEKNYARAVRNVPWCGQIWQNYIRFYEKVNKPLVDLQKLVENALSVGFSTSDEYKNLWFSYLEYLRRKLDDRSEDEKKIMELLRKNFDRACEYLETFQGDPTCEIKQFWARTEAIHGNNMEEARRLWSEILYQKIHSESAASWLEYISLERCYGDTKKLRKLFQKSLTHVTDFPEIITNAWLNFERDEGTLEQMESCEKKIKEQLEKVAKDRQKSQLQSTVPEENLINKKIGKRKIEDEGKWKNLGPSTEKKAKLQISSKSMVKENIKESPEKNKNLIESGKEMNKLKIAPPPGYEEIQNPEKMEEESEDTHEVDDQITIFISNLDYTATEEEIREVLKPVGPITLFRLVTDYKNRSKGFGYVQLTSPEAVEEALKLDRVRVNSRPMFISRCDSRKTSKGPQFKYPTEIEKNKLFVKGLSPATTKDKLEEVFKIHGNLKDIRIVTYRNGHSKGLAYIEYENEQSAAKALVATDGINIDDKPISVAISQPPKRKVVSKSEDATEIKSLGGSSTSRTQFGNPKTILSMIPRTVKRNTPSTSQNASDNGVAQPLSNQDFRNMLLKK